jgi:hypothetical protein
VTDNVAMDFLTLALLLVASFALAVAGARSVLVLVLRFMAADQESIAITNPGPTT